MSKKDAPHDRLIPQRIRNRRETLGLAAYELAERAGISPSYLSLIESGSKLPSEEIAVRIAEALDDDPDLYRAWVQASRYPNLAAHVERLARLERVGSTPELRARVRSGGRIDDEGQQRGTREKRGVSGTRIGSAAARMKRWARRAVEQDEEAAGSMAMASESFLPDEPRQALDAYGPVPLADSQTADAGPIVEVPLLADGADPGDEPGASAEVIERLRLDSQLLPAETGRPFAYRPGAATVERVNGLIRPGDVVVLAARPLSVDPSSVYAVRHEGRVILSRVVRHGNVLLLLPSDTGGRPIPIESPNEQSLLDRLAGVVVTTVRSWERSPAVEKAATRPQPSGYAVRLEDDFLVRDCHWKEKYGWRPIQRPEDLDYLEAHPGTKIRFRLLRDGRVRYLLEMSPDEWRAALGDYVDGPTWRRNGYIVAITRRQTGQYSEEFQDRWARYVSEVAD